MRLNALEPKLEAALRAGKRQSAPFSRGEPKADLKRPGRKSGNEHGRHGHRQPPEQVDETVAVDVRCGCPDCGGKLEEAGIEEQWQEEIPVPGPIRRRFVIHVGRCRRCGRQVRGRHLLQTSQATGAAAAQVGPEALSQASRLHYELGLSMAKTAAVLHEVCGISITRGGLAQALASLGERCAPTYGALVSAVRRMRPLRRRVEAFARELDGAAPARLTPREVEVSRLVASGLTNREIAGRLRVSVRTVESHVDHVLTKLGLSSRVQLGSSP